MDLLSWIKETFSDFSSDDYFEDELDKWVDRAPGEAEVAAAEAQLRSLESNPEWSLRRVEKKLSYDVEWLKEKSELIYALKLESGNAALNPSELMNCILATLQSSSAGLENDLLELIGFEFFELALEILQHRNEFVESFEQKKILEAAALFNHEMAEHDYPSQREKVMKKKGVLLSGVSTQMHLEQDRKQEGLSEEALRKLLSSSGGLDPSQLPGVYSRPKASLSMSMPGSKLALPEGTARQDTVEFEQFCFPFNAAGPNPRAAQIKLKPIKELDELSRIAFPGYTSLNQMQSAVFTVVHETNENILVCAPTGAGKTDVAMLSVLRCILDHTNIGSIQKDSFKIVYVAPMKALAAEITEKFGRRLKPFGLSVREYTGDMQLTRSEVQASQMIVTTPEKWDVITRKGQGDSDLVEAVRLLIIDEVHLLQDERGPVIETIIARTLRAVELSQKPVRIVGLSATLPNYLDVAMFLRVNLQVGLFYFDDSFRPVPLTQTIVGVKGSSDSVQRERTNKICFQRARQYLRDGHQVMVFVHSRNETVTAAKNFIRQARENEDGNCEADFLPGTEHCASIGYKKAFVDVSQKSRNRELQDLFRSGMAMHHAGMLRSDRNLVEQFFSDGHIRLLVCTATLAWGVNLPAHAVIIKGTQLWDSQKGGYTRLGVLDVLQIFGRAGRPQYESHGEAILITKQSDLPHYLTSLMSQTPIESRLGGHMVDNLNAEISLGTVTSVEEAVRWLGYTYLSIRMARNPTAYGITPKQLNSDPRLEEELSRLVKTAAVALRNAGMINYDQTTGRMAARDVGRIASLYYLSHGTVELFGRSMSSSNGITEETVLAMVAQSREFEQLRVRPEELEELDTIDGASAPLASAVKDNTSSTGKAALLIQAWISRHPMDSFSLTSDLNYVGQNAGRVMRAAWEMARSQGWVRAARACLSLSISFERRVWMTAHPLCQILLSEDHGKRRGAKSAVPLELLEALQSSKLSHNDIQSMPIDKLAKLPPFSKLQLGASLTKGLETIKAASSLLPTCSISEARCYPISKTGYEIKADLDFSLLWNDKHHGHDLLFHVWLEGADGEQLVTRETLTEISISKDSYLVPKTISFFLGEPLPPRIFVRVLSDRWNLPLMKFEVKAKGNALAGRTSSAVPSSEGVEVFSEILSLVQVLGQDPEQLSPIQKASLVLVESGGLFAAPAGPDQNLLISFALLSHQKNQILIVVPNERFKKYPILRKLESLGLDCTNVKIQTAEELLDLSELQIDMVIIDRLELMDARYELALTKHIQSIKSTKTIFAVYHAPVGNSAELASWLGIPSNRILSFGPESRPAPLQAQIQGFPGRYHASRMASMNKPAYQAVSKMKSEGGRTIIWCPSRKQAMNTAQALVSYANNDDDPGRFVTGDITYSSLGQGVVQHCASFGVGLAHLGFSQTERVLSLFKEGHIGVLVLALEACWLDTELSADLVIIKGTDIPSTEDNVVAFVEAPPQIIRHVLSFAARSAIIMTRDNQKSLYKNLLCEAPLYESALCSISGALPSYIFSATMVYDTSLMVSLVKSETLLGHTLAANPLRYGCNSNDQIGRDEFLWRNLEETKETIQDIPRSKSSLSFQACSLLAFESDAQIDTQTVLKLVARSVFIELETRKKLTLDIGHCWTRDPVDLESFCRNSGSLGSALKWFSQPHVEYSDGSSKVLLLLLARIAGVTSFPRSHWKQDLNSYLALTPKLFSYQLDTTTVAQTAKNAVRILFSLQYGRLPFESTPKKHETLNVSVFDESKSKVSQLKANTEYLLVVAPMDKPQVKVFVSAAAAKKKPQCTESLLVELSDKPHFRDLDQDSYLLVEDGSGKLLARPCLYKPGASVQVQSSTTIPFSSVLISLLTPSGPEYAL